MRLFGQANWLEQIHFTERTGTFVHEIPLRQEGSVFAENVRPDVKKG